VRVRDAVQDDAEALAALADLPVSAAAHLVVERTVRVAERDAAGDDGDAESGASSEDGGDGDGEPDADASDPAEDIRGFVAFDARPGVVHVTQLAGDRDAVARLLEEPVGFARREGMAVEAVVPESAGAVGAAVETAGFETVGAGPRFEGERTRRYRLEGEN
jgi:hypothetical protein